jgi:hypothetical protein
MHFSCLKSDFIWNEPVASSLVEIVDSGKVLVDRRPVDHVVQEELAVAVCVFAKDDVKCRILF